MSNWIVGSKEARTRWHELLGIVSKRKEAIVISRHKKPIVALISFEDYETLGEQLEELSAARRAAEAHRAWQLDESLGRPYATARAELVQEGLLEA